VRKLLVELKEYLHQTYCQQDSLSLGEKLDVERGVMVSKAGMFVAVLIEEEERERWNREERNL
jgi:hypothetical protein